MRTAECSCSTEDYETVRAANREEMLGVRGWGRGAICCLDELLGKRPTSLLKGTLRKRRTSSSSLSAGALQLGGWVLGDGGGGVCQGGPLLLAKRLAA